MTPGGSTKLLEIKIPLFTSAFHLHIMYIAQRRTSNLMDACVVVPKYADWTRTCAEIESRAMTTLQVQASKAQREVCFAKQALAWTNITGVPFQNSWGPHCRACNVECEEFVRSPNKNKKERIERGREKREKRGRGRKEKERKEKKEKGKRREREGGRGKRGRGKRETQRGERVVILP